MYLKKNKLLLAYESVKKKLDEYPSPLIFACTQKIDIKNDILSLIELNEKKVQIKIYWSQISKKNQFLSIGETLSLDTSKLKKETINSNIKIIIENTVHINNTNQNDIPIFIGGQNFNINQKNSDIWKDFNSAIYKIPKILIIKNDNLITITSFICIDKTTSFSNIYDEISNYYKLIKNS